MDELIIKKGFKCVINRISFSIIKPKIKLNFSYSMLGSINDNLC